MQNQPQSSRQIVLQPLPKAVGINPAFCTNAQKTLLMKEKIMSIAQDGFHIHDENNQQVCFFDFDSYSYTLSQLINHCKWIETRESRADKRENKVLQVRAKVFSLHAQKEFFDAQNNPLFTLKHKLFSIPKQYYGEPIGGGNELFRIKGKWHCKFHPSFHIFGLYHYRMWIWEALRLTKFSWWCSSSRNLSEPCRRKWGRNRITGCRTVARSSCNY